MRGEFAHETRAGWYCGRCNLPYYTAKTPDNEYCFELERDALLFKMRYG